MTPIEKHLKDLKSRIDDEILYEKKSAIIDESGKLGNIRPLSKTRQNNLERLLTAIDNLENRLKSYIKINIDIIEQLKKERGVEYIEGLIDDLIYRASVIKDEKAFSILRSIGLLDETDMDIDYKKIAQRINERKW